MGKISSYFIMPHPPIAIPEVGKGEEQKINKTTRACQKIAGDIASIKPDTIILITPHGPLFRDAVAVSSGEVIKGNLKKFATPDLKYSLKTNLKLIKSMIQYAACENIFLVEITPKTARKYGLSYELDHGAMVPLYFINKEYQDYKLIHITYGLLPKLQLYRFGMCIKKAVEESSANAVFVASGDLSHKLSAKGPYEYSPYGARFDKEVLSLLTKGDVLGLFNMDSLTVEEAGECGLRSFYIMLGAMNGLEISGELLSYEGPFGVGYGVMSFQTKNIKIDMYGKLMDQNKRIIAERIKTSDPYVRLARESLTHYLTVGTPYPVPDYVTTEMTENKRGVFVSLKKEGQLRGCIGTIRPTTNSVAEEIIRNSVEAGLHDPRFSPVSELELAEIDISVDVLTVPEKAIRQELNPQRYGVIVRSGRKTGLLLPDLPGVDTVEKQLKIALQKGNISARENYSIERFEVIRHK